MKANWLEVPAGTRLDADLAQRAAEYDAVKVGDELFYVLDFGDGIPRFSGMPKGALDYVISAPPLRLAKVLEWEP